MNAWQCHEINVAQSAGEQCGFKDEMIMVVGVHHESHWIPAFAGMTDWRVAGVSISCVCENMQDLNC